MAKSENPVTDADADGMHIATLLIAFFFMHMRAIIEDGSLYIGKSPLFGIFPGNVSQDGTEKNGKAGKKSKKPFWVYSEEELEKLIKKEKLKSPRITRFKGLGEMNPKTLWDTTLDPDSRTLLRVAMNDEEKVMEALKALMGNDPSTRYALIQENAAEIEVDV